MKTGIERIAAERYRQIDFEKWTPEHDDEHIDGEMVRAAVAYAMHGVPREFRDRSSANKEHGFQFFPCGWSDKWWKPRNQNGEHMTEEDRIRHLEKAGALLAAEIDRLQRVIERRPEPSGRDTDCCSCGDGE